MKKIGLILMLVIGFNTSLFADNTNPLVGNDSLSMKEIRTILKNNGLNLNQLKNQGLKLLKGEWTWVGKKVGIEDVRMLITKRSLVRMNDVSGINYQDNSLRPPTLNDVESFTFNNKEIPVENIKALIVK